MEALKPIDPIRVQKIIDSFLHKEVYIHLETTTGAYTSHHNQNSMTIVAFVRNAKITFSQGKIKGTGPYRVGLKTEEGWVYAEGLTDYTVDEQNRLLMAGHDRDGKLAIALQISETPFT